MEPLPFIDIHTHQKNPTGVEHTIALVNIFAQDFEIASLKKSRYYSVGLHPWHINESHLQGDLKKLEMALSEKSVIALGEAGLDRLAKAPIKIQEKVFHLHLQLAQKFNKPLIVHAVKSYPDIIAAYKRSGTSAKLIIHGFSVNPKSAEQLIKHGFYLSFGAALLDTRKKAAEVLKLLLPETFFLESDNSEINITGIYQVAASIKKINIEDLKTILYQNFKNCFGNIL